jgi:DUF4097 and DUF4098 domain-containing protein YvlB
VSKQENNWPSESIDAVSIRAAHCKLAMQGINGDKVELKYDFDDRPMNNIRLEVSDRKLNIDLSSVGGHPELLLRFPKTKAWNITVYCGKAEVNICEIRSRFNLMTGNGDIYIEQCSGTFMLGAGKLNARIKQFTQEAIPCDRTNTEQALEPQIVKSKFDWQKWAESDWPIWGEEIAEKITSWALRPAVFFVGSRLSGKSAGISIQAGHGNIEIEGIDAELCLIKADKGSVEIKEARIADFDINLSRGDIECKAILPLQNWNFKTIRGDISLSIPSNVAARLDMATRNGNINSSIPLVRVNRQGPESYGGSRMVGATVKSADEKTPELKAVTLHGNIEIKSESTVNNIRRRSEKLSFQDDEEAGTVTSPAPASAIEKKNQGETGQIKTMNARRLSILESLSTGQISVEEAERQLSDLDS